MKYLILAFILVVPMAHSAPSYSRSELGRTCIHESKKGRVCEANFTNPTWTYYVCCVAGVRPSRPSLIGTSK